MGGPGQKGNGYGKVTAERVAANSPEETSHLRFENSAHKRDWDGCVQK